MSKLPSHGPSYVPKMPSHQPSYVPKLPGHEPSYMPKMPSPELKLSNHLLKIKSSIWYNHSRLQWNRFK